MHRVSGVSDVGYRGKSNEWPDYFLKLRLHREEDEHAGRSLRVSNPGDLFTTPIVLDILDDCRIILEGHFVKGKVPKFGTLCVRLSLGVVGGVAVASRVD